MGQTRREAGVGGPGALNTVCTPEFVCGDVEGLDLRLVGNPHPSMTII